MFCTPNTQITFSTVPLAKRVKSVYCYSGRKNRTVEEYKKILSNPQALDLINNNLIKYGKLEKAYNLIVDNAFSLFKRGDEQTYNFLHTFKVSFPNVDTNAMPNPKLFQEAINSMGEHELEELRKQGVRFLLENPSTGVFFIFSLSKKVIGYAKASTVLNQ